MFLTYFLSIKVDQPAKHILCFMFFVKFLLMNIVNLQSYDLNKNTFLPLPRCSGRDITSQNFPGSTEKIMEDTVWIVISFPTTVICPSTGVRSCRGWRARSKTDGAGIGQKQRWEAMVSSANKGGTAARLWPGLQAKGGRRLGFLHVWHVLDSGDWTMVKRREETHSKGEEERRERVRERGERRWWGRMEEEREALPLIGHNGQFKIGWGIRAVHVAALDWPKVDFIYLQIQK